MNKPIAWAVYTANIIKPDIYATEEEADTARSLLGDYWVGTDPLYAPLEITGKKLYEKWWDAYGLVPYYAFDVLEKKSQSAWNELAKTLYD